MGSSTNYKETFMNAHGYKEMSVTEQETFKRYMADKAVHHIIPEKFHNHAVIKRLRWNLHSAENLIHLPQNKNDAANDLRTGSVKIQHTRHDFYSRQVGEILDEIKNDPTLFNGDLKGLMDDLRSNLRKMLESSVPIYLSKGAKEEMFRRHATRNTVLSNTPSVPSATDDRLAAKETKKHLSAKYGESAGDTRSTGKRSAASADASADKKRSVGANLTHGKPSHGKPSAR